MKTGIELIAEERATHEAKGWDAAHDDLHDKGQMARVASDLAGNDTDSLEWASDPWGLVHKHRNDRVKQLVIAGALIAAEIDRLQRLSKTK